MPESTLFRGLQPLKFFVFRLCFSLKCKKKRKHKESWRGRGGQKTNLCVGFLWVFFCRSLTQHPLAALGARKGARLSLCVLTWWALWLLRTKTPDLHIWACCSRTWGSARNDTTTWSYTWIVSRTCPLPPPPPSSQTAFKSNTGLSDRKIHAPPPQNRRPTSQVQNWGWCVLGLFLRFRQFTSASPKVSHKRVFTLVRWQPGSANTGFCSIWAIFWLRISGVNSANTLLCDTLALSHHTPPPKNSTWWRRSFVGMVRGCGPLGLVEGAWRARFRLGRPGCRWPCQSSGESGLWQQLRAQISGEDRWEFWHLTLGVGSSICTLKTLWFRNEVPNKLIQPFHAKIWSNKG